MTERGAVQVEVATCSNIGWVHVAGHVQVKLPRLSSPGGESTNCCSRRCGCLPHRRWPACRRRSVVPASSPASQPASHPPHLQTTYTVPLLLLGYMTCHPRPRQRYMTCPVHSTSRRPSTPNPGYARSLRPPEPRLPSAQSLDPAVAVHRLYCHDSEYVPRGAARRPKPASHAAVACGAAGSDISDRPSSESVGHK